MKKIFAAIVATVLMLTPVSTFAQTGQVATLPDGQRVVSGNLNACESLGDFPDFVQSRVRLTPTQQSWINDCVPIVMSKIQSGPGYAAGLRIIAHSNSDEFRGMTAAQSELANRQLEWQRAAEIQDAFVAAGMPDWVVRGLASGGSGRQGLGATITLVHEAASRAWAESQVQDLQTDLDSLKSRIGDGAIYLGDHISEDQRRQWWWAWVLTAIVLVLAFLVVQNRRLASQNHERLGKHHTRLNEHGERLDAVEAWQRQVDDERETGIIGWFRNPTPPADETVPAPGGDGEIGAEPDLQRDEAGL